MRIVVVGAGGLGGFFGRSSRAASICKRSFVVHPVRAVSRGEDAGPADLVIIAVKLWETNAAARSIRGSVGPQTAVVSFQNGVDAADLVSDAIEKPCAIGGVAYIGASIESPGVVTDVLSIDALGTATRR